MEEQVKKAIETYRDPYLDKTLVEMKAVKSIQTDGNQVSVEIELPYPATGLHGAIKQLLSNAIEDIDGVESVSVTVDTKIIAHKTQNNLKSMARVKNIIAVASGKGGVGKSTTSVNLALALAHEGAKVGLLDADIYGPSVGLMLGIEDGVRPKTINNQVFVPIEAHGIQAMSMAFLVTEETPMVWRGPMVSGALQQLIMQSHWEDLDYMIIDMPPGTGDIQLTLSQKVPVTGSVIVTTPQNIALLDCKKGIEMFRKVDIPVLGVIENMSVHICSNCGHEEPLFGANGGEQIAQEYDAPLLGKMPLHATVREQTDSGRPTVVAEPDSEISMLYIDMARKLTAMLSEKGKNYSNVFPEIVVTTD